MKDAKGHGSDAREGSLVTAKGKGVIPSRPFREGDVPKPVGPALKLNAQGQYTGKLFGKRSAIPAGGPAHQSRIRQLVTAFVKSDAGEGKVPHFMKEFDIREKDPSHIPNVIKDVASSLSEHHIGIHELMHFVHFLGFLGAVAVVDMVAQGVIHLIGS